MEFASGFTQFLTQAILSDFTMISFSRALISVILVTTTLCILPAAADFHIMNCLLYWIGPNAPGPENYAMALPSNQYSCSGVDNAGHGLDASSVAAGMDHFSGENVCGNNLDFYWNGSDSYDMYIAGGDGSVVGWCYPGGGDHLYCNDGLWVNDCTDAWICYSYICN